MLRAGPHLDYRSAVAAGRAALIHAADQARVVSRIDSRGDVQKAATVPKREWRRAWRALPIFTADPTRIEEVFEITDALSGRGSERAFQEF